MGKEMDVDYEREMLEHRVDAFLRSKGWRYTCETPGSFWLWERKLGGRTLLVSKDLALSIQKHMSEEEVSHG